jgi:hypothetical protein
MTWFPTIRSCVLGGALVVGAAAGVSGVASATAGDTTGMQPSGTMIIVQPAPQPESGSAAYYLQQGIEAQSQAAAARQRAQQLSAQNGEAYKSDEVQQANDEALMKQAKADAFFAQAGVPSCQALAPTPPPPSPELKAAEARLDRLRGAGGWAYKNGDVARAEADVKALTPGTQ